MSMELTLRPYLETVRTLCAGLSKADLTERLCQIAATVPSSGRNAFLEQLKVFSEVSIEEEIEEEASDDDFEEILSRVESLACEILESQESMDDNSWNEDYYEELLETILPEHKQELEDLFSEADFMFLNGNLLLAEKLYGKLIEFFRPDGGYDLLYSIDFDEMSINWRETLARRSRCVYETSVAAKRTSLMLAAMDATYASDDAYGKALPSLQDVFDAKAGELSGWNEFLQEIKTALHQNSCSRAFLLCLEAVHWTDGMQALVAEVRKRRLSVGYLYWLDLLRAAECWHELAQAAQESLESMSFDFMRACAADHLSRAGEHAGDTSLVLKGKREQFFSLPQEKYLAVLLQEAMRQNVKESELQKVLDFLQSGLSNRCSSTETLSVLKAETKLLLGDLIGSMAEIDKNDAVGWSGPKRTTAIVYASILLALKSDGGEAPIVECLFVKYAGAEKLIAEEIRRSILSLSISAAQKKKLQQLVEDLTVARIDHIVSNKHRRAYSSAAEVMGGFMECLMLTDQTSKASAFLNLNKNQQYRRFSAFRSEIDSVLARSPLLKKLKSR